MKHTTANYAASYNHHADDVDGAMAIPRSSIVNLTELRSASGRGGESA